MSEEALTEEDLTLVSGGDDDEVIAPEWIGEVQDADLKTALSKFDTEQKFLDALGFELTTDTGDWREGLPEELKPVAERFTSTEDIVRAVVAFQKREGQVRVPGKDATDTERTAYQKAVGVPESPTGYEFPALPEGEELTDQVKTSRETWAKRFHALDVPKDMAKALIAAVGEDAEAQTAADISADNAFAKTQEDALRTEWKGDEYEKNVTLAGRAFAEISNRSGLKSDDLKKIETKDGRFLMDRPEIIKLFAVVGREMAEGTLGPALTDAERNTLDEELVDIRKQTAEAQQDGDSKRANMLYQREQALIAKKQGNKPVVGAAGRVV